MHKYQTLLDAIDAGPTPGPWKWDGDVCNYNPREEAPWIIAGQLDEIAVLTGEIRCAKKADADFIVAACNSAPSLLEDNERLREALSQFTDLVQFDTCPTRLLPQSEEARKVDQWWLNYLTRVAEYLASKATKARTALSLTGAQQ